MGVWKQLKTEKEKIEYLLQSYPAMRKCDKKLMLGYFQLYCNAEERMKQAEDPFTVLIEISLKEAPSFETIGRCRRKFQEVGEYLPDESVVAGRKQEEHKVRDWAKETDYSH